MQLPIGLFQCYPRGWALSRLHESRHVQLSVFYWINQCALQHVGLPSLSADNICRQCWFISPICSQSLQVWWTYSVLTSRMLDGRPIITSAWRLGSVPQIESNCPQRLNLDHLVTNFLVPRMITWHNNSGCYGRKPSGFCAHIRLVFGAPVAASRVHVAVCNFGFFSSQHSFWICHTEHLSLMKYLDLGCCGFAYD